jgi:hypothetical protein
MCIFNFWKNQKQKNTVFKQKKNVYQRLRNNYHNKYNDRKTMVLEIIEKHESDPFHHHLHPL